LVKYYDKAVRGTEAEDLKVIIQFFDGMIGQTFSFLNYYKEIPVSYDAVLLGVEDGMAEFEVHAYQAKVINIERRALIYSHELSQVSEDIIGEAFYVNSVKKRVILCRFAYARIRSVMRRFVRVALAHPVEADLIFDGDILKGNIQDISLSGASVDTISKDLLEPGLDINLFIKLPDFVRDNVIEVGMSASIVRVLGDSPPFKCIMEFHPEKHSQQQIAYYINQRQVQIIKELKDIDAPN